MKEKVYLIVNDETLKSYWIDEFYSSKNCWLEPISKGTIFQTFEGAVDALYYYNLNDVARVVPATMELELE